MDRCVRLVCFDLQRPMFLSCSDLSDGSALRRHRIVRDAGPVRGQYSLCGRAASRAKQAHGAVGSVVVGREAPL